MLLAIYILLALGLSTYGVHRLVLLRDLRGLRPAPPSDPPTDNQDSLPLVAVQLPVYNEVNVAERLIRATAAMEYPRDKLEIQILDDSTDGTTEICERLTKELREGGLRISHIRRADRIGYKAGALQEGLNHTDAGLLAIFDADFVPPKEFLLRTVGCFQDEQVGMVQARWGHLNRSESWLTRLQALALDAHFLIEQKVRGGCGLFFNFNGTAGVWRRRCIEEAGGWQADTLTEDLDLSYRAQLCGWKFLFLPDLICPAELPGDLAGYRAQQYRWTKGSVETCRKHLTNIWKTPGLSWRRKTESTLHLGANFCHLLLLGLCVVVVPASLSVSPGPWRVAFLDLPFFVLATGSLILFYGTASRLGKTVGPGQFALLLPGLMAFGIGMTVHNSRAVLEGLYGRNTAFLRTPKKGAAGAGGKRYHAPQPLRVGIETALALYFWAVCLSALVLGWWALIPFLLLFAIGFSWVSGVGLLENWRDQRYTRLSVEKTPSDACAPLSISSAD